MKHYAYTGTAGAITFAQIQCLLGWLQQGFESDTPVPPELQGLVRGGRLITGTDPASPDGDRSCTVTALANDDGSLKILDATMHEPVTPACEHRTYKRNVDLGAGVTHDACSRCPAKRQWPHGTDEAGPWSVA